MNLLGNEIMRDSEKMAQFWDYLIFYPEEDEAGFDGVHYGSVKDIKKEVPHFAKEEFALYMEEQRRAKEKGKKLIITNSHQPITFKDIRFNGYFFLFFANVSPIKDPQFFKHIASGKLWQYNLIILK